MPILVISAIIGGLVALLSFLAGIAAYSGAASAIHEIYAALLMISAMLGLVLFAVSIGAAVMIEAVRAAHREASADRRGIAGALRLVAEHRRAA